MTDFDKRLIEKARNFKTWEYRNVEILISIADTPEARTKLREIYYWLRDLLQETI